MKICASALRERFTVKQISLTITAVISFLLFIVLFIASGVMKNSLESQQMAKRWSGNKKTAQISCFISGQTEVTPERIVDLGHQIEGAITESGAVKEEANGRPFADAYSAAGEITIQSSRSALTASAVGIGGDFFLFHPLKLLTGSYFSGSDLMQDSVIMDEDAAWQLFGSNDIIGMQVMIEGIPHLVKGVIERDTGRLNDRAGNGKTVIYVSYGTLAKYGKTQGISTYEIVMPNPISAFALNTVKEKLELEDTHIEVLENTKRFDIASLGTVLLDFGTRSMNSKGIIYPYWENIARGYEDILALLLLFQGICLIISGGILAGFLWHKFKNRTWHVKDLREFTERCLEKAREKKAAKNGKIK